MPCLHILYLYPFLVVNSKQFTKFVQSIGLLDHNYKIVVLQCCLTFAQYLDENTQFFSVLDIHSLISPGISAILIMYLFATCRMLLDTKPFILKGKLSYICCSSQLYCCRYHKSISILSRYLLRTPYKSSWWQHNSTLFNLQDISKKVWREQISKDEGLTISSIF